MTEWMTTTRQSLTKLLKTACWGDMRPYKIVWLYKDVKGTLPHHMKRDRSGTTSTTVIKGRPRCELTLVRLWVLQNQRLKWRFQPKSLLQVHQSLKQPHMPIKQHWYKKQVNYKNNGKRQRQVMRPSVSIFVCEGILPSATTTCFLKVTKK